MEPESALIAETVVARQVRLVRMAGNYESRRLWIEPYKLNPDQRVLSSTYWRSDGNQEHLVLVIEEDCTDES